MAWRRQSELLWRLVSVVVVLSPHNAVVAALVSDDAASFDIDCLRWWWCCCCCGNADGEDKGCWCCCFSPLLEYINESVIRVECGVDECNGSDDCFIRSKFDGECLLECCLCISSCCAWWWYCWLRLWCKDDWRLSFIECVIDDGNRNGEFGDAVSNSCISTVSFGVATLNPELLAAILRGTVQMKVGKREKGKYFS